MTHAEEDPEFVGSFHEAAAMGCPKCRDKMMNALLGWRDPLTVPLCRDCVTDVEAMLNPAPIESFGPGARMLFPGMPEADPDPEERARNRFRRSQRVHEGCRYAARSAVAMTGQPVPVFTPCTGEFLWCALVAYTMEICPDLGPRLDRLTEMEIADRLSVKHVQHFRLEFPVGSRLPPP